MSEQEQIVTDIDITILNAARAILGLVEDHGNGRISEAAIAAESALFRVLNVVSVYGNRPMTKAQLHGNYAAGGEDEVPA